MKPEKIRVGGIYQRKGAKADWSGCHTEWTYRREVASVTDGQVAFVESKLHADGGWVRDSSLRHLSLDKFASWALSEIKSMAQGDPS